MSTNKCYFAGVVKPNTRLTNGYELRFTATGTPILTINLCVTESFKGTDGEVKQKSTYIPLRVWGKRAEEIEAQLSLYAQIEVVASYCTRSYTPVGSETKKYEHSFDVYDFKLVSAGGSSSRAPAEAVPASAAPATAAKAPSRAAPVKPAAAAPKPIKPTAVPAAPKGEGADDDIPF